MNNKKSPNYGRWSKDEILHFLDSFKEKGIDEKTIEIAKNILRRKENQNLIKEGKFINIDCTICSNSYTFKLKSIEDSNKFIFSFEISGIKAEHLTNIDLTNRSLPTKLYYLIFDKNSYKYEETINTHFYDNNEIIQQSHIVYDRFKNKSRIIEYEFLNNKLLNLDEGKELLVRSVLNNSEVLDSAIEKEKLTYQKNYISNSSIYTEIVDNKAMKLYFNIDKVCITIKANYKNKELSIKCKNSTDEKEFRIRSYEELEGLLYLIEQFKVPYVNILLNRIACLKELDFLIKNPNIEKEYIYSKKNKKK